MVPEPSTDRFTVSSRTGLVLGLALLVISACLLAASSEIGWGVGWTTWVPALALLVPGVGLIRRRVLHRRNTGLEIESGWFMRRGVLVPVGDWQLEHLPTAGLWAVVLHRRGSAWVAATWLRRHRSEALLAWLDAFPGGPWPRRETILPAGDR